jgi:L-asparaginase II
VKNARFTGRASADELARERTRRQLKLITAIMAHPSYQSAEHEGQTTQEGRPC